MRKLLLIAVAILLLVASGLVVAVRMLLSPESVRAAVARQASATLGMPVSVGAANVRLWPRPGLTLDDVIAGDPAQVTIRRAQISTGLRPLLSRRVEDAEVVIEDSRLDLPKLLPMLDAVAHPAPAASASGPAAASESADATSRPSISIINVKTIALRNVELVAGDRRATVDFESALAGDRLDISRLSARAGGSSVRATGAVESLTRRVVRLDIDANPLDLDGFLQFAIALTGSGTGMTSKRMPARGAGSEAAATQTADTPLDVRAHVRAAQGGLLGITFANLDATITVTSRQVMLAPLALQTFGGRVTGEIAVPLTASASAMTLTSRFEGIDLRQLSAFAGQPSAVTGTLGGRMHVTVRGFDQATALRTASGTGEVALLDGRLPGLDLVRPAVLAFGRPASSAPPAGSGEHFDRIAATLAIGNGEVRTNDLRFQSRDVDMTGAGTLGITSGAGALNLRVDVQLSQELSAQAGRDLVRYAHEGDRVVLPATITGTVSAPRVWLDEGQVLRRALRNEAQERVKSLFNRLLPGSNPKP
jgi:uncharacterized protein involved in outer membrane biogenesis